MRNERFDSRKLRKTETDERGMTLLEVIVSVALLGFLALGTMSLLGVAVRQNNLAKQRTVATSLASGRIHEILSERFHAAAKFQEYKLYEETPSAGPPMTLTTDYGDIPGFPEYRRVVTLSYDVPQGGMLRVQSSVFWHSLGQGEKEHRMITFLHPGMDNF